MGAHAFRAWRRRMALDQPSAAIALGVSVRSITGYECGRLIGRRTELACAYLEEHPEILVLLGLRAGAETAIDRATNIDIPVK